MEPAEQFGGVPGLSPGSGTEADGGRSPARSSSPGEPGRADGDRSPGEGSTPAEAGWVPPESDFFAVVDLHPAATVATASDGDLWPSAWADDGALYTACGDGLGFQPELAQWSDIVVNRIEGTPEHGLTGTRLAAGREVARVWTEPELYNSKPTGMIAVDGNDDGRDELYLAVQDLRCGSGPDTFNTAPAAGIVTSRDYGHTWTGPDEPMFTGRFTTVMFADLGQSNSGAAVLRDLLPDSPTDPADYAYAYGLDHNWRTSYSGVVPDPTELYLARVHRSRICEREAWEFCAGTDPDGFPGGRPRWSTELAEATPVLTDTRRVGTAPAAPMAPPPVPGTRLAQGGVVYNAGLGRFLYTSWTEHTFQFYEAPTPWGPWRHFLDHDFGPFPWTGPKSADAHHGGYGTTVPSKFISADGRRMWLQSNWFVTAGTYTGSTYHFSLRPLRLEPMPGSAVSAGGAAPVPGSAPPPDGSSPAPGANLARLPGVAAIARAARSGHLDVLNDGETDRAEDSWNGQHKEEDDHWGYTWPQPVRCTRLEFTSGPHDYGAGWFARTPRVQVRSGAGWQELHDVRVTPPYPQDWTATGTVTFTFTFPPVRTTGIRLVGPPGGWGEYTSISELAVYDDGDTE
ncbi:MAG TPA: DUF4185 domain-containing protein [Candidatus Ruania gallistercoris]|uniref:DUF4185 domain-containing protein n=1 Tax=Candidatus Ruania gallistercoris TaxID=2838746 RepID=A0A9D2EH75_9MICO|nr:DUF4185 domain-containing protein [Candidatus Ruania gallistercoris]